MEGEEVVDDGSLLKEALAMAMSAKEENFKKTR
jgi:hypothetical protein